jgi:hypothetical protein
MGGKMSRATIVYPMVLADQFMAQLVLPRDLSRIECNRICAMLNTLVMPDHPLDRDDYEKVIVELGHGNES